MRLLYLVWGVFVVFCTTMLNVCSASLGAGSRDWSSAASGYGGYSSGSHWSGSVGHK
jgi:hypothetical protein